MVNDFGGERAIFFLSKFDSIDILPVDVRSSTALLGMFDAGATDRS